MAPNIITKSIILTILCLIITKPHILIQAQQQVSSLFVFGDSQFDNGNNNNIKSLAKVNYPPYGIDYPDGPTGRFASGNIIPDFIAEILGFEKHIPPFVTAKGPEIIKGVNYASGAAGILDITGSEQGDRIYMNMQLQNHKVVISNIKRLLRNSSQVKEHLNKGLYIINMGSNDYYNNYFLTMFFNTSLKYTPEKYADLLMRTYSKQLRTLYKYGARKVVIFGLGHGCLSKTASMYSSIGSPCENGTHTVQLFNDGLRPLVDNLNRKIPDAKFIVINAYNIGQVDPSSLGIKVPNGPCCKTDPLTGLCVLNSVPCSNRSEYYFWDNHHPSEVLNRVFAERAYKAKLPTDVYPFDIYRLLQT